jgi:phosphoadenosine phosphosulfate reductase
MKVLARRLRPLLFHLRGGHSDKLDIYNNVVSRLSAEARVAWAAEIFGDKIVVSTSFGIQSPVMLHLVTRIIPEVPIVFVDTGYLFPETYQFAETLTKRLALNLKTYNPIMTPARQEAMYGRLWEQGIEGLRKYNLINKVEPMDRALVELQSTLWLTGIRRSQSVSRQHLNFVSLQNQTFKLTPILDWSDEQVDAYLQTNKLPQHPLKQRGYVSVGDWHSTSVLKKGMTPEQTRFQGIKRECGLHEPTNIPGYKI